MGRGPLAGDILHAPFGQFSLFSCEYFIFNHLHIFSPCCFHNICCFTFSLTHRPPHIRSIKASLGPLHFIIPKTFTFNYNISPFCFVLPMHLSVFIHISCLHSHPSRVFVSSRASFLFFPFSFKFVRKKVIRRDIYLSLKYKLHAYMHMSFEKTGTSDKKRTTASEDSRSVIDK